MKLYELTDKGRALLAKPRHTEPTNWEHCCSCCAVLEQRVRDRDAALAGKKAKIKVLEDTIESLRQEIGDIKHEY